MVTIDFLKKRLKLEENYYRRNKKKVNFPKKKIRKLTCFRHV